MAGVSSAFELSDAAREAICNLVDNDCPLNRSEQPRFIFAAYVTVFVPWGFLALFDMITERWKTIRAVACQGLIQILFAIPTLAFTIFYIEIQRRGRDYKEMCAAIVLACLSLFHSLRTLWGLWQLFHIWTWVKRSLRQLHQHGYSLKSIERDFYYDDNSFWQRRVKRPIDGIRRKLRKLFESRLPRPFESKLLRPPESFGLGSSYWSPSEGEESVYYTGEECSTNNDSFSNQAPLRNQTTPQNQTTLQNQTTPPRLKRMMNVILKFFKDMNGKLFKLFGNKSPLYYENERQVGKLAAKMYINSSVIDNEFFDCDVPFKVDLSALRHPIEWSSSKRRVLSPLDFSDSCVRYMVTFLAQYGRRWLEDSKQAVQVWEDKETENGLVASNFLTRAQMMTGTDISESDKESDEVKQAANWSNTWSRVLLSQEKERSYAVEQGLQMPFGFPVGKRSKTDDEPFSLWFGRYKSRIKRLIDNLPPGLFRLDPKSVDIIENICPSDLENFIFFLQSKPVAPLETVKNRKPVAPLPTTKHRKEADQGAKSDDAVANISRKRHVIGLEPESSLLEKKMGKSRFYIHEVTGRSIPAGTWKHEVEFVVHLENFFAIIDGDESVRDYRGNRKTKQEQIDWDTYLQQLRLTSSVSSLFIPKDCRPRCSMQRYYWQMWNMPEMPPPALGDTVLTGEYELGGSSTGIRFIGYIAERVRNCLAAWTEKGNMNGANKSSWTVKVPSTPVKFKAKSDLSMFFEEFQGRTFPHIAIDPLSDERIQWERAITFRVVWECQQHLLEVIDDVDRVYGPGDMELMLLFLLGFPALVPMSYENEIRLVPKVPQSFHCLVVMLSLTASNTDEVYIEMKIRERTSLYDYMFHFVTPLGHQPRSPTGHMCESLEMCWIDWIHAFDAAMKVVSVDFVESDLCNESSNTDVHEEGETGALALPDDTSGSSNTDVHEEGETGALALPDDTSGMFLGELDTENDCDGTKDGENEGSDTSESVRAETNLIAISLTAYPDRVREEDVGNTQGNENRRHVQSVMDAGRQRENEGQGSTEDRTERNDVPMDSKNDEGRHAMVGARDTDHDPTEMVENEEWEEIHRCACTYRLDKKARQQKIDNSTKFYWDWEGWKAQPIFREQALLFEAMSDGNANVLPDEEERDSVRIQFPPEELEATADRGEAEQTVDDSKSCASVEDGEEQT